ncbi:putative gamma-tubulin complex component GCP4 [Aspergillus homomorphus CBS 101889]|uniref:Spindle pole body component n=1 Tax=Aspergillus homomorphus (strain CBS 101889) TaxID=1450537 RepID=A0A395I4Q4_ASPHC|nr:Spc98 family protein [Aspergillus homomorphus CBS 101889]RAL14967.1 Spc98 family protein [Aspergillus homomorphus CBS 101889]
MLHEILLCLSGQPSPLFDTQDEGYALAEDTFPLVSPSEKALLASLAHLSRLHAELRQHTATISASHESVICRAVSTAISSQHLREFQKKILEVEKAILVEDSGYVGGYGIVPLSTIVGEFSPWTRRLEWMRKVVRHIQFANTKGDGPTCSSAALIDHLRAELQTGYADVREIALSLVNTAETAWVRQLSTWLLYGNLPILGRSDFFIQEENTVGSSQLSDATNYGLHSELLPQFVLPQTAASILFIGKTLNLIRAKRSASSEVNANGLSTSPVTLREEHIKHLAALKSPMTAPMLSSVIVSIRLSLSQSTLSTLLPTAKILETLSVLHGFLLLGRGEFVTALVSHADSRLHEKRQRIVTSTIRNKASTEIGSPSITEADVMATLTQTLSELYSLQDEEDPADDLLDLAKAVLRSTINGRTGDEDEALPQVAKIAYSETKLSNIAFDDLLFPIATSLSVQVNPPLDLFLSTSDVFVYSKIHSYLLGIRRAHIHLGDLWKRTSLRRCHPSPLGPPRSNTPYGQNRLKEGRQRHNARLRQMRAIWATCSGSLFVLSEIGSYFQGEIINESWQHFQEWIKSGTVRSTFATSSRPGTASSSKSKQTSGPLPSAPASNVSSDNSHDIRRHDPETITAAHRRYLFTLVQALFLTDVPFTKALRSLLTGIEHFIALVVRLENIQRNMDLETDEGVFDSLVDYAGEEREVWQALGAAQIGVEGGIRDVVSRLRDIDDSRSGEGRQLFDMVKDTGDDWSYQPMGAEPGLHHYVPRKAAGVDRLLMKLEFGNANGSIGPGAAITSEIVGMA